MSTTERNSFVRAVLDLYLGLPHSAARRPSRSDRLLAEQLFDRAVPFEIVQAAFRLALARRDCRPPSDPPLPLVRSLHYFTPIIDELLAAPHHYTDYINSRFRDLLPRSYGQTPTLSGGQ